MNLDESKASRKQFLEYEQEFVSFGAPVCGCGLVHFLERMKAGLLPKSKNLDDQRERCKNHVNSTKFHFLHAFLVIYRRNIFVCK